MINVHFKDIHCEFRFQMESKYLVIRGDSAIGKTTFWELVGDSERDPSLNIGDKCIKAITGSVQDIEMILNSKGYVFVLDETCLLWDMSGLDIFLQNSNNYFILIGREEIIGALPIGLDSICTVKQSGGVYTLESVYPKQDHLRQLGDCLVCEDSKSGKQFLETVLNSMKVESAGGKSNFGRKMRKLGKNTYTVVFDRSGINVDYDVMHEFCKSNGIDVVSEIDWDSFEAYILESPEYDYSVEGYPNKEIAATEKMKELFSNYNKSSLPATMKLPIYWKVREAQDLMKKSCSGVVPVDAF